MKYLNEHLERSMPAVQQAIHEAISTFEPYRENDSVMQSAEILIDYASVGIDETRDWSLYRERQRVMKYGVRCLTGFVVRTAEVHPDPAEQSYIDAVSSAQTLGGTLLPLTTMSSSGAVALEVEYDIRLDYVDEPNDRFVLQPEGYFTHGTNPIPTMPNSKGCPFAQYFTATVPAIAKKFQQTGVMENVVPAGSLPG